MSLSVLVSSAALAVMAPDVHAASSGPPAILSVSVQDAGPTIAVLQATIAPNGADASYHFEYGNTASYESQAPTTPATIGAGAEEVTISQSLEGLSPDTVYHYRLVVASSEGVAVSEDLTFSTFGINDFKASVLNADGTADEQAGSHPFEVVSAFTVPANQNANKEPIPAGMAKDINIELPPGLVANPLAVPRCPDSMLAGQLFGPSDCPPSTQVGLMTLRTPFASVTLPVYNLVPPAGMPAQFGVFALIFPVTMDASVRTGGDYGTTISLANLSQVLPVLGASFTFWGVPADERHDPYRGSCLGVFSGTSTGDCPSEAPPAPFISLPTSCGSPLTIGMQVDTWEQRSRFLEATATVERSAGEPLDIIGCERLAFEPSLTVQPDTTSADTPVGLTIDAAMGPPDPPALTASALRDVEVLLPEGMSLNASAADGLGACAPAQIALASPAAASCPDSSKIGGAEIDTPLLADPLTGYVYLAQPGESAMLAAYLAMEGDGVRLKLPMQLAADPLTGRLTVRLSGIPQLPFSDLRLSLYGGPRAALANPGCGEATTTATFRPYAAPPGSPPVLLQSAFQVAGLCGGGFSPALLAGSTSPAAGGETSFTLRLDRADGQQRLRSFSVSLPPGLLAQLGGVPLCPADRAAAGTCDQASRIGTVTIAAGAGSHPFYLSGDAFLTGPYLGAPFGLSVVVPTQLGPFNFGPIVVMAQISVAPRDLHLTIASDPLPQTVGGIPLRLRMLHLAIDRPGFLFNPTACAQQVIGGQVRSAEGASVSLTSPFQTIGCAALGFSPSLTASTEAKGSDRGEGTGVRFSFTARRRGQANIRSLTLALYGGLRPRLTTIQQACRAATFFAGPSGCPAGSVIGAVTMTTPMLSQPLRGRLYLVFRGGAAYPDMVAALEGQGISEQLDGIVRISRAGAMTTTFTGLPDVPVGALYFQLSRGPHSILGSVGRLCSKPPRVRYRATAHNGKRAKGLIKMAVAGCRARRRIHDLPDIRARRRQTGRGSSRASHPSPNRRRER